MWLRSFENASVLSLHQKKKRNKRETKEEKREREREAKPWDIEGCEQLEFKGKNSEDFQEAVCNLDSKLWGILGTKLMP